MFVRLADEGVHFLFEWQRDTYTNGTLRRFRLNRMRSFICCLHQTGAASADDIAAHLCKFGGEFLDRFVSWCGGLEACRAEDGDAVILSRCATETCQFINDVP